MRGFTIFVFALLAMGFGAIGGYFHDWPNFGPVAITVGVILAILAGVLADLWDIK